MKRKNSITTGVGDRGTTRLYSGEEVPKYSPRVEAVGTVDEAVSALGLARCFAARPETKAVLLRLQRAMFTVGSELATSPERAAALPARVDAEAVRGLDAERAALEARVACPAGFILPGGTPGAAHLDHARSVVRRCERVAARLAAEGAFENPQLLVWLNRLSDYLWLLARDEEGASVLLKEP